MSKKTKLKPVAIAVGAAFATTMAMSSVASATQNPFAMQQLDNGYKLAASSEGNCGANQAREKAKDANCGANKAEKKVKVEGKCGEAKCGANKK